MCLKADEERRCKELRQQKFVNGRSEKMLGKMRLREARRIFQTLRATYDDAQGGEEEGGKGKGAARLATHLVDIEAVDVDVLGVVAPLLAALAPDKVSLDVTEFCGMLDEDLLARIDGPQVCLLHISVYIQSTSMLVYVQCQSIALTLTFYYPSSALVSDADW